MSSKIQRRGRRALRTEGMTLVEIMIVVIIMALIATAVGIAVVPQFKRAQERQTKTDAATVASIASQYMMENHNECPTVADLVSGQYISAGTRSKDAWEHDFTIDCSEGEAVVRSSGPDGQDGTEDDITNLQGAN